MQFTLDMGDGANFIRAYEAGKITVNDTIYQTSLIVTPETIISSWPPHSLQELVIADLEMIKTLAPEVVLLGTGTILHFPPQELLLTLTQSGIGVEVMTTAAACRTYNVLMAERRKVVAGLIID
ncbi:Mth938-like domain-containing protein [soil metagenome]